MGNYRFICSHCGKSFESPASEVKECPFCFWSSSVKREDELAVEKKRLSRTAGGKTGIGSYNPLYFAFKVLLALALVGSVGYFGYLGYRQWDQNQKKTGSFFSVQGEKGETSKAEREVPDTAVSELSSQERDLLLREVSLPERAVASEAEKIILAREVKFKTGWSDQLPSPAWSLAQYEQMIAEQERFYKITLPRSYKKKLTGLFENKYLAGVGAFAKGDLLATRDLFIESLLFPPYSTNVQKHRGVALTMLKPFITDTLSKIGALNQMVADQNRRQQGKEIEAEYGSLFALIQEGRWEEAILKLDQLQLVATQMQSLTQERPAMPPYPSVVGMIDQDIQRSLAALSTPGVSSTTDLLHVREDLAQKKDVLVDLSDEAYNKAIAIYQEGMTFVREGKYKDAFRVLSTIRGPETLRNQAQTKLAILAKVVSLPESSETRSRDV